METDPSGSDTTNSDMGFHCYGNCLEKALPAVRRMNARGISASLSYLPVRKKSPRKIAKDVEEYHRVLHAIERDGLDCDVTLKPHQLGLYANAGQCRTHIVNIVERAQTTGNFVWIDMKRSNIVDATIGIFESVFPSHRNVGICLQAYLRRTEHDLRRLLANRVPIRLVKGFYREHDFRRWSDVTPE